MVVKRRDDKVGCCLQVGVDGRQHRRAASTDGAVAVVDQVDVVFLGSSEVGQALQQVDNALKRSLLDQNLEIP